MKTPSTRSSTPHLEMRSIGRSLADPPANEESETYRLGRISALIWTALVLLCLLAFVGWLLVGLPPHLARHL
jgi:hypothetical protein